MLKLAWELLKLAWKLLKLAWKLRERVIKCFSSSFLAKQCFSKGVLASFSQFQQERSSKCFSNSVLTPFWPFSTKVFQQEIVLAFGCFSTGFLAQILLAFGCFSKLVFQHKGFSAYERFSIWVFQLRCLFSNCQCFSIF